jgi:hypothetical protein
MLHEQNKQVPFTSKNMFVAGCFALCTNKQSYGHPTCSKFRVRHREHINPEARVSPLGIPCPHMLHEMNTEVPFTTSLRLTLLKKRVGKVYAVSYGQPTCSTCANIKTNIAPESEHNNHPTNSLPQPSHTPLNKMKTRMPLVQWW